LISSLCFGILLPGGPPQVRQETFDPLRGVAHDAAQDFFKVGPGVDPQVPAGLHQ